MSGGTFPELSKPTGLNTQQLEAAHHMNGPLLIYAGAGSGKTLTISHSIAHLIENYVPASAILAVTFTNKAAKELKERVENLVGWRARNIVVSTFHSACVRFLRVYAGEIGYTTNFSIYDDTEKTAVLKAVIKEMGESARILTPAILETKIDRLKNAGLSPHLYKERIRQEFSSYSSDNFRRYGEYEQHELIQKCYEVYQSKLQAQNAMDFGDLILETVNMLETKPHVLRELQSRFTHFLVDEFQDTNPIQFKFLTLLSGHTNNLRVVGDDDQSIYSWRGAEPGFILDFNKHYPDAVVIKLEQNYRSTGAIIQAAAHVITHNRKRAPKTLWTAEPFGELIHLKTAANVHDEADFVCDSILRKLESGKRLSEMAILYRTNAQSRIIEDNLRRRLVPYIIYGSVRFYERAEIKILLGYLKLLVNPSDDVAFKKAIGVPRRGFGEKAVEALQRISEEHHCSLLRAGLKVSANEITLPGVRGVNGLKDFCACFMEWHTALQNGTPPSDVLDRVLSRAEYQRYLAATYPEDFDERWLNVVELKNALIDFEEKVKIQASNIAQGALADPFSDEIPSSEKNILAEFLHQAMLVVEPTSHDVRAGNADAVSLMTIHAAKGLEFDTVFLIGLEEGSLPHLRSLEDPAGIEEERRLMYVAMTRARRSLTISRSRDDIYRRERNTPSRFLSEIPGECLDSLNQPKQTISYGIPSRELTYVREDDDYYE
jgi:DNA helicase-2/ATP-dependent DNA helicase PcrA